LSLQNTFKSVSAGFTVPTPRLPPGGGNSSTIFYEATALVGLDGVSPCVNTLQAGVDSFLETDGVTTNYVGTRGAIRLLLDALELKHA
jgi:hypothetical protein